MITATEKKCYRCHEVKPFSEFHRDSSSKDGYTHKCKPCQLRYKSEWQKKNREKARAYSRRHLDRHSDRIEQARVKQSAQRLQERLQRRIDRSFENGIGRYWERRERQLAAQEQPRISKWRDVRRRREKGKAYAKRRVMMGVGYIRYHTNAMYNTHSKVTVAIRHHLKEAGLSKNRQRTFGEILPYTKEQLIERLKATMPRGYKWQDYLDGKLHIDHIIPKAMFHFTSVDDAAFKACWALANLQLLPRLDNIRKNDKITPQHHPELKLWHA
jgi:hypothetical protein